MGGGRGGEGEARSVRVTVVTVLPLACAGAFASGRQTTEGRKRRRRVFEVREPSEILVIMLSS